MNVTEAIAEALDEEGVEYLFGFPSHPLLDTGAAEDVGIRTIVVRQERTGVHMADGIARVTSGDNIVTFVAQHGPGTENSVGGIAQAYAESAPLVALPAGYTRAKTNVDPKFSSLITYQPVTKTAEQLTDPDAVGETIRRAFNNARNGRPRPTLVELPLDVHDADVSDFDYTPSEDIRAGGPDPEVVEQVADELVNAEEPMLYAGQGVHYAKAWEPLKDLAELLEAPVATSLNGKSAFPEDHPLSLGAASKSEPRELNHFLHESDVLFGTGCSFSKTSYGMSVPNEGKDKTVIHNTVDAGDVDKDVEAEYALIGDAKITLEAVYDAVAERLDGPRGRQEDVAAEIRSIHEEWMADWEDKLTSDEKPINPYRVVQELNEYFDKDEVIATADAGNARDMMAPFFEVTEPLSYLGWGKTTQLGYGLGLMMGAKLVRPEKTCIHVMGDGAIGMTGLDFETAAREEIPILGVVFNNFEMASYDTPFSGHYANMVDSLGGHGERVEEPGNITAGLDNCVAAMEDGKPALLEVLTSKETSLSRPDLE